MPPSPSSGWRAFAALAAVLLPATVAAQTARPAPAPGRAAFDTAGLLTTIVLATPAPAPGHEAAYEPGEALVGMGWTRDALGNYLLRRGAGSPRRVVACGLDRAAYVVSQITDDGYLRLQGSGNVRRHPLWDQFHEGQRVVVESPRGDVPGVVGVRSTHLWRRRATDEPPASIESLWVDVGARSRAEAERAGIALLAPVRGAPTIGAYGADTLLAGPDQAARAACAAVVSASRLTPARGETVFVLSAQSAFGYTGLSAVLARSGPVDTLVLVDAAVARGDSAPDEAVTRRDVRAPFELPRAAQATAVVAVGVRSRFPGTLVESVAAADLAALATAVRAAAGVAPAAGSRPPRLLADVVRAVSDAPRRDSVAAIAGLLTTLAETYAVSEHEGRMRDAVRAALPAWARSRLQTDTAGNLVLALGPDRDTAVFVAHLDEIGYEVVRIARDGVVSLRRRGGFYESLWEGQPALLHFETDAEATRLLDGRGCRVGLGAGGPWLAGVFVPRQSAATKQPAEQRAWFGTDSAGLAACGVRPGMAVTGVKRAARLAGTRFTARSVDDRVGCAALILALREIDPARLSHKVIFVWSVREETALGGAAALAATLGPTVHRVYAVDTFVSSDAPLESRRFAYAPIGAGAVVRALDNSSATPPAEVQRVVRTAAAAGIPLQVGTTNGGNDGSQLARHGAVDIPLSWPARYSHSPVETIDLLDVRALVRLVSALARE